MRQIPCKMYGSICKLLHIPCTMRGSNSKTRYILHKPRSSLNTFSSVLGCFFQCQNGVWILFFLQWNSIFFPGLPREGQTPNWHWSPMLPTAPSKKAFKRTKTFIPLCSTFSNFAQDMQPNALSWSVHVFDPHNRKLGLGGSSWRSWRTTWNLGRSPRRGIRLQFGCRDSKCRRSLCTGFRIRVLGYCGNTARWFWLFLSHSCSALHSQHLWMMALAKQATHATFLKESGEFPCCNKPSIRSSWRMWAPRSSGPRP